MIWLVVWVVLFTLLVFYTLQRQSEDLFRLRRLRYQARRPRRRPRPPPAEPSDLNFLFDQSATGPDDA